MTTEFHPATGSVESLGKVIYHQKPSTENQIAGLIISVLLVAGGVALCWLPIREIRKFGGHLPLYHEHDMSWAIAAIFFAISIGLIIGGVVLWRWVWSMFSFCLYICSEGFYFTRSNETVVFAWKEIRAVEETVRHERLPIVKGPAKYLMPTKTSSSYRVVRCDDKEFSFDANTIPRVSLLAGPLSTNAQRYGYAWTKSEVTS